MATYDLGDVVALGVNITDANGDPANATFVVATVTNPLGVSSTPTVVNSAMGSYDVDYTPTIAGRYIIRWVATGDNASAYQDEFTVRDPNKQGIVSFDEVKQHLNIPATTTTQDEELRRYVDAATDLCESYVGCILGRETFTLETYSGNTEFLALRNPRAITITAVYEAGVLLDPSQYSLDPTGQRLYRLTAGSLSGPNYFGLWANGVNNIQVTYVAGFIQPPFQFKQGVLETIRHLWQTQRGPSSVVGRGQQGDEFATSSTFSLPRRVMELLDAGALPGIA